MSERKMTTVKVTHGSGYIETISTDEPELLGRWLIYTAHKLPEQERYLVGNWHVYGWTLR